MPLQAELTIYSSRNYRKALTIHGAFLMLSPGLHTSLDTRGFYIYTILKILSWIYKRK